MLFTRGDCKPGETVLVQGAGGGLATAAIALGAAAGLRVWTTSRDEDKRVARGGARRRAGVRVRRPPARPRRLRHRVRRRGDLGALAEVPTPRRPPRRLRRHLGHKAVTDLRRAFFLQLNILGSTMGTRDELENMLAFMAAAGVKPIIDRTLPLSEARDGLAAMASASSSARSSSSRRPESVAAAPPVALRAADGSRTRWARVRAVRGPSMGPSAAARIAELFVRLVGGARRRVHGRLAPETAVRAPDAALKTDGPVLADRPDG